MDDYQKESIHKFESNKRRKLGTLQRKKQVKAGYSYLCGWPNCRMKFADPTMRAEHRYLEHPDALFVENKQQLDEYRYA